jgi:hypothetical protein
MKNIIKQILTETVMDKLIGDVFPQLNDLKTQHKHSTTKYGTNTVYYNKDDKEYYFRVSEPRKEWVMNWDTDKIEDKMRLKTLWVNGRVYDGILNYLPSKDMILKWFNEKYNQDAEIIIRRSPLKGR